MYSCAKMEVDFLFCTDLPDFSPEKMRDFSDSRLEKVCANVEARSEKMHVSVNFSPEKMLYYNWWYNDGSICFRKHEKMEKQPEAETFGCYGGEAGWKNLANEGIWSSIL